jgi:uncharacterized membrane protein
VDLELSPLGWIHFLASLIGVGMGAAILPRPKGTPLHKLRGRIYALALLATGITALGIYRLGVFFFPHWLGIAALVVIALGVAAAHFKIPRRGWLQLHLTCMLSSYYILIGGGVNELFLRVIFLRRLVPNLNSPIVGMTHAAVIVLFAILITYFLTISVMRGGSAPETSKAPRSA